MVTKKSKPASVSTQETSVSLEVTKPRARTKSSTSPADSVSVEKPVKGLATVRHTRVSSRKPVKSSVEPTGQSITSADVAFRAYHIWLERGCAEGTEFENWTLAEQELRALAAGQ